MVSAQAIRVIRVFFFWGILFFAEGVELLVVMLRATLVSQYVFLLTKGACLIHINNMSNQSVPQSLSGCGTDWSHPILCQFGASACFYMREHVQVAKLSDEQTVSEEI